MLYQVHYLGPNPVLINWKHHVAFSTFLELQSYGHHALAEVAERPYDGELSKFRQ